MLFKYINDGNVIFLDASSTVSYLIPYLEKFNDIIVLANSPKTSMKLGEKNIKNYCKGRLLLKRRCLKMQKKAITCTIAVKRTKKYEFNICDVNSINGIIDEC